MNNTNFSTSILVAQSAKEVFDAVNNPRGWWSEQIEGSTDKVNDQFKYHFRDIHRCTIRITEQIVNQKVVWSVLDNYFNFTRHKDEWIGNTIIFEISQQGDKTQLRFTQYGLVPDYECYAACSTAWTNYINGSLCDLITTGHGKPITSAGENDFENAVERTF